MIITLLIGFCSIPLTVCAIYRAWPRNFTAKQYKYFARSWSDVFSFSHPIDKLAKSGYWTVHKISNAPFGIKYWGKNYLVLPLKYVPEIQSAPINRLNMVDGVLDNLYVQLWTPDILKSGCMSEIVRIHLNKRLVDVTDIFIDSIDGLFNQQFGDLTGSAGSFTLFEDVNTIVTKMMTRLTVGKDLAEVPTFYTPIIRHIKDCYVLGFVLVHIPITFIRELLAKPFTYFMLFKKQPVLDKIVEMIQSRRRDIQNGHQEANELSLAGLAAEHLEARSKKLLSEPSLDVLAQELIHNILAGYAGIVNFTLQMLYHALTDVEYFDALRAEADEAVQKYGWSEEMTRHLPLQDSYLREINRFYPMFSLSMSRLVKEKPWVFSDGFTLPIGTKFVIPSGPSRFDSLYFDDPNTFDGFRWARLAEEDKRLGKSGIMRSSTTANIENITFGVGAHACPGRFTAIRCVRVIFTKFITEYDLSWNRETGSIPPRVSFQGVMMADPYQKITMTKRKHMSRTDGSETD